VRAAPGAGTAAPEGVFRAMDRESPGSAMLRASNVADYIETIQQP
jgi:hypothetical protein